MTLFRTGLTLAFAVGVTMATSAGARDLRIASGAPPPHPATSHLYNGLAEYLPEDEEPRLDLNHLLHALYDRAGFDLRIDYGTPPVPPLTDADAAWAAARATNPTRASH